jgi:hypothetical protein
MWNLSSCKQYLLKSRSRSFHDVIEQGYKVVAIADSSNQEVLSQSEPGTAMHEVYYSTMDGNDAAFVASAADGMELIKTRAKTLFFAGNLVAATDPSLVALKLSDSVRGNMAFGYRKDSEYSGLINLYLRKLEESGALHRISKEWDKRPLIRYGMEDAVSLGYDNVMFPFSICALGVMASAISLTFERMRKRGLK